MRLIDDILSRLTSDKSKRLTIVFDTREFLLRTDVRMALEEYGKVNIQTGNALQLRIACEKVYGNSELRHTVFVTRNSSIQIMPDIYERAIVINDFDLKDYCRWYDVEYLLQCNLEEIDYCYQHKASYKYTTAETTEIIKRYRSSESYKDNVIRAIISQWNQLFANVVFQDLHWLPSAADIICQAIAADCYELLDEHINHLNDQFQAFLRSNYFANIVNSTLSTKISPRVVTQVLPFIHAHHAEKKALIVVDGMNVWQGTMLVKKLKEEATNNVRLAYTYSWIPSVTELSRQAIFRGANPVPGYIQSPNNEEKLFVDFLKRRHLQNVNISYMHGTMDGISSNIKWLAFVDTTLDDAMHSANHNGYLYDDTKRWVEEFQENIETLLNQGFTIYITSDHGNVYTKPYKRLKQYERVGAEGSHRYISLPQQANPQLFHSEHGSHVMQLEPNSSTFFPVRNLAFANDSSITHGGTHLLEVIVPFITLSRS